LFFGGVLGPAVQIVSADLLFIALVYACDLSRVPSSNKRNRDRRRESL